MPGRFWVFTEALVLYEITTDPSSSFPIDNASDMSEDDLARCAAAESHRSLHAC